MESPGSLTLCVHIIPEFIELLLLSFSMGVLVCHIIFAKADGAGAPPLDLASRIWRCFAIAATVMTLASIGDLLARTAEMSGVPLAQVFGLLPTVIAHAHLGHLWLIRIAALLLLAVSAWAGGRFRGPRGVPYLMLGVVLVIAMTRSATGHAADSGDFSIPELVDWLHLDAVLVWGGGVFALALAIFPGLIKTGDQAAPLLAEIAARFSRIAGLATAVIALTAVYNAVVYAGSLAALVKTPYGAIMIAKAFLFILLILLGAINRYLFIPVMAEWAGHPATKSGVLRSLAGRCFNRPGAHVTGRPAAGRFNNCLRLEALLMAMVLFCSTMLRHEVPARHFLHAQQGQISGGHDHEHKTGE
ncbi:MAG TPA: CopD family protein [Geobacteraceae bacterium]|nr:CopD family protein [Geobacteraceae bacterium]